MLFLKNYVLYELFKGLARLGRGRGVYWKLKCRFCPHVMVWIPKMVRATYLYNWFFPNVINTLIGIEKIFKVVYTLDFYKKPVVPLCKTNIHENIFLIKEHNRTLLLNLWDISMNICSKLNIQPHSIYYHNRIKSLWHICYGFDLTRMQNLTQHSN